MGNLSKKSRILCFSCEFDEIIEKCCHLLINFLIFHLKTSQLIEVVTWSSGDPTLIHSLRAHTRMVTDIDWHSKAPHLLASCSIDTFTHLWDLRDPRKPILSLSAVCMCKYFT